MAHDQMTSLPACILFFFFDAMVHVIECLLRNAAKGNTFGSLFRIFSLAKAESLKLDHARWFCPANGETS